MNLQTNNRIILEETARLKAAGKIGENDELKMFHDWIVSGYSPLKIPPIVRIKIAVPHGKKYFMEQKPFWATSQFERKES